VDLLRRYFMVCDYTVTIESGTGKNAENQNITYQNGEDIIFDASHDRSNSLKTRINSGRGEK